jgi:hypothetical protein
MHGLAQWCSGIRGAAADVNVRSNDIARAAALSRILRIIASQRNTRH